MADGDATARQLNYDLGRKPTLFTIVNVTENDCDWRNLLQLLNDGSLANVPGVEDMIDASEVSPDSWVEQAVSIGNYSDPNGSALVHRAAPG
jgi:hypothetical protein